MKMKCNLKELIEKLKCNEKLEHLINEINVRYEVLDKEKLVKQLKEKRVEEVECKIKLMTDLKDGFYFEKKVDFSGKIKDVEKLILGENERLELNIGQHEIDVAINSMNDQIQIHGIVLELEDSLGNLIRENRSYERGNVNYFNIKGVNNEVREKLKNNETFFNLLDEKHYIENTIEHFDYQEEEFEIRENLKSLLVMEINKIVGYELEHIQKKYEEKEYVIKNEIKLKDGNVLEKGTKFNINGFKSDNCSFGVADEKWGYGVLYEISGKNISDVYLSEDEIVSCSALSLTKDIQNEEERRR